METLAETKGEREVKAERVGEGGDGRRKTGKGGRGTERGKVGGRWEREEVDQLTLGGASPRSPPSPLADELPAPSLVALPGPVVAPGANVSLRCAGRWRGMSFALYREGEAAPVQYRDSPQLWADFPLLGASAAGTYSCYYHTPSSPYVLSRRSEPLVISLEGEGPRDPAPSPSSPRPRSPDTQPLLPQTWDPGPPSPPPLDLGVWAPSPSSPRPRRPGLLPPPPSDPRVAVPSSSIPLSFVSPSPP